MSHAKKSSAVHGGQESLTLELAKLVHDVTKKEGVAQNELSPSGGSKSTFVLSNRKPSVDLSHIQALLKNDNRGRRAPRTIWGDISKPNLGTSGSKKEKPLTPADLARLFKSLGFQPARFAQKLHSSDPAVLKEKINQMRVMSEKDPEKFLQECDLLSPGIGSMKYLRLGISDFLRRIEKIASGNMPLSEKRFAIAREILCLKVIKSLMSPDEFKKFRDDIHDTLTAVYMKTKGADGKSPLFDTDGDGTFDNEDAFALDARYQKDSDKDGVPDETDSSPKNRLVWNDLPVGKRFFHKGFASSGVWIEKMPDGTIRFTVKIHLVAEAGVSPEDRKHFEERMKASVEEYLGRSLGPQGMSVVVEFVNADASDVNTVHLFPNDRRATTRNWGMPVDVATVAHEIGHFIGIEDRYHEYDSEKDRTFTPGYEVISGEKEDVMGCDGPKLQPEDSKGVVSEHNPQTPKSKG